MFCLRARKGFCEGVGCHVVGRAVNKLEGSVVDDEADEMIAYVDMFGTGVIVAIGSDGDGRLVVTMECCGFRKGAEDFTNEVSKPDCFLGGMGSGDVFGFSG